MLAFWWVWGRKVCLPRPTTPSTRAFAIVSRRTGANAGLANLLCGRTIASLPPGRSRPMERSMKRMSRSTRVLPLLKSYPSRICRSLTSPANGGLVRMRSNPLCARLRLRQTSSIVRRTSCGSRPLPSLEIGNSPPKSGLSRLFTPTMLAFPSPASSIRALATRTARPSISNPQMLVRQYCAASASDNPSRWRTNFSAWSRKPPDPHAGSQTVSLVDGFRTRTQNSTM